MADYRTRVRRLAGSLTTGPWQHDALLERVRRALDGGPPDPGSLTARLLLDFAPGRPPPPSRLVDWLRADDTLYQALRRPAATGLPRILLDPPVMQPPSARFCLPVPTLATLDDLQRWLGVRGPELSWLADRDGRQARVTRTRLHHYRYRWIEKRRGGWRLIEQPKADLKAIQRRILHEILDRVAAHSAAHGFRRRRSCRSHAAAHTAQAVVLQLDLQDFFTSVPTGRVAALFRRLGYPAAVAHTLQGLCTHATSLDLAAPPPGALDWERRKRLQHKHLAQGAPSSPALANLCAWRLDCRLAGLARRFGLVYTRYADDLAFSGDAHLSALAPWLQSMIGAIALDEGFRINHRKTRLATRAARQALTGIVVNARPNLARGEFDRLKATLYNCVRHGPSSQNRAGVADFRAHLQGRLAHARWINPDRAERLQRLWRQIDWST